MMKNAVITGATQGIGKAIAEKLLSEGLNLAFCARNETDVASCIQQWQAQFPHQKVAGFIVDLSKKESVIQFAKDALQTLGNREVLINNAGIYMPGSIADEEDGNLEQLLQVNLLSAYHLTRSLLPHLHTHAKAHIFNMCSVASLKAYPHGGSYSISKYALLGFSDNLREELKESAIRVTAIEPGATYSRSWEGAAIDTNRIMEANDIAIMLWAAMQVSKQANVEHIVIRPIKGDL
jgi:short-subunit dehydrogenase